MSIKTLKTGLVGILLLAMSACTTTPPKLEPDDEKAKLRPVPALTIPTAVPSGKESEEGNDGETLKIRVLSAPDISARGRPDIDLYEKGYDPKKEPIKVKLLNYWDDSRNYFANINFQNTGRQILKTIYIFGYDRLGRLVSTRADQTFFREKANIVRTLRFGKNGQAVRWTILVKN